MTKNLLFGVSFSFSFFSEAKAHLRTWPWRIKNLILGLKTAYIWCIFSIQRAKIHYDECYYGYFGREGLG